MAYRPTKITETTNEYLLEIDPSDKQRARDLKPNRWDPDRKVWVFPRTKKSYQDLIGEFADDAMIFITAPADYRSTNMSDENDRIFNEINNIKNLIRETEKPKNKVENAFININDIKTELNKTKDELLKSFDMAERYKTENEKLAKKNQELLVMLEEKSDGDKYIKHIAASSSGDDPVFKSILEKIPINEMLPFEISKKIEEMLRKALDVESATSFSELINIARDADFFESDDIYYAIQNIRRIRNKMAHEIIDSRIKKGYVYYSLFSAAIIWHSLPE